MHHDYYVRDAFSTAYSSVLPAATAARFKCRTVQFQVPFTVLIKSEPSSVPSTVPFLIVLIRAVFQLTAHHPVS